MLRSKHASLILTVLLLVILVIPVIAPLFRPGFFVSDDGEWMIIRFTAFYEVIRDGQFPVRFLSRLNNGYGYPVANFLYPGFMYLGVPLHVVGLSFVDTIKVLFGVSFVVSVIATYFWLVRLFGNIPAIIGALFYAYSPYHLFDFYKRGSLGEMWALAIAPIIFWQIERRCIYGMSIGIGFLLISHNTLSMLFLPIILLYMLLDIVITANKHELSRLYLKSLIIGFGMSAFFWLPAIYDLQYTVFSKVQISEWQRYFADNSLIGISTLLIFLLTISAFLVGKARISSHRLTLLFLCIGLLALFFSTPFSKVFWNILPVSFIQFPFRFLSVTILTGAFLVAFVFSLVPKKFTIFLSFLFVLLLVFSSQQSLNFMKYAEKEDSYYATNLDTTTVKDEYMPRWVTLNIDDFPNQKVIGQGMRVDNLKIKPSSIQFQASVFSQNNQAIINTVYFPGWEVLVNDKPIRIDPIQAKGLIAFSLPVGSHVVVARFKETPVRLFADVISFISALSLLIIFIRSKK